MNLVNVAIAGATGYSGEELIRLLIRHPGHRTRLRDLARQCRTAARGGVPEIPGPQILGTEVLGLGPRGDCRLGRAGRFSGAAAWGGRGVCRAAARGGHARHRSVGGFPPQGSRRLPGISTGRNIRRHSCCGRASMESPNSTGPNCARPNSSPRLAVTPPVLSCRCTRC